MLLCQSLIETMVSIIVDQVGVPGSTNAMPTGYSNSRRELCKISLQPGNNCSYIGTIFGQPTHLSVRLCLSRVILFREIPSCGAWRLQHRRMFIGFFAIWDTSLKHHTRVYLLSTLTINRIMTLNLCCCFLKHKASTLGVSLISSHLYCIVRM